MKRVTNTRSVQSPAAESRSYESPLRAEQRERTRERILDAATELLAQEGFEDLTIPVVARQAGVSVRTVYCHFPTKEALHEAVADLLDRQVGSVAYPDSADELPRFAAELFESFGRLESLIRATLHSTAGREVRQQGRKRRLPGLEKALEKELSGLDPVARRQVLATLYVTHNSPAWQAMRDYFGLSNSEAAAASAWATRALLEELRRNPTGIEEGPK